MPGKTLQARYAQDDQARQSGLNIVRLCSSLTKPWILPPEGQSADSRLPESFQSLGSRGVTNLVGRMLLALYPPEQLWWQLVLSPEFRYSNIEGIEEGMTADEVRFKAQQMGLEADGEINAVAHQFFKQSLYILVLQAQAILESADLMATQRRRASFRSRKRISLDQIIVTGDSLEFLTDDNLLKVFRRDQYVTQRDSAGDVLYHIVKEHIDPLSLEEEKLQKANIPPEKLKKYPHERAEDMYTLCEYQPDIKKWLVTQEMNGNVIFTREETVTPFFSTPFELAPGENYGRGFVELNIGDLRSYNEIRHRHLDFAAAASKHTPVIDPGSIIKPSDLEKDSGEAIIGEVNGGVVTRATIMGANKFADFRVVHDIGEIIRRDLSKAMLIESEMQPQKERVTAEQIRRIAFELEGALGGAYAPIADEQQVPLLKRVVYKMQKSKANQFLDRLVKPGIIKIEALTGLAALGRQIEQSKVLTAGQIFQQLPPEAQQKIDWGVWVDLVSRTLGLNEPGLIRSTGQEKQESQQAQQAALQQAAAEQAIQSAGTIAENVATDRLTGNNGSQV